MKIALTVAGSDLDAEMDPRFGRAARFIIVDPETMDYKVVENQQNLNLPQGAGIQAAKTMVENQVAVVITGHCGPKAFRVLSAAGVDVVLNVKGKVSDAVARFKKGEFVPSMAPDVDGHWV